jgi:hypothetical protein
MWTGVLWQVYILDDNIVYHAAESEAPVVVCG